MKRFLKKFLLGLLLFLVVLIGGAAVMAGLFEEKIGNLLVREINKQLTAELSIEDFDISVVTTFPSASANLRGVVLTDAFDGVLLEAKNAAFRFGILSLLGSSVKVHSVIIEEGALHLKVNKNGRKNYYITPESAETAPTSSSGGLALSLEEARLQNIELIYEDEQAEQYAAMIVDEAVFSGEFASDRFSLKSFAELQSRFVDLEDMRYLAGKALTYDADIVIDLKKDIYDFEKVEVGVDGNVFKVDGLVTRDGNFSEFDLWLTSEEGSLESILQLLPAEQLSYFGDFSSRGSLLFDAKVQGRMGPKLYPKVEVTVSLDDGRISSPKLEKALKDVSFTATFTNGESNHNYTSVFEIKDFKGYFNRELIELGLHIGNFDDPRITFQLNGALPLDAVYGLLDSPVITDGDGEIEIDQLKISGRYDDMINMNQIRRVKSSGRIEFDDAELTINKERMIVDRGDLVLANDTLKVEEIKIEGAGSEIILDGEFTNVLPVLFADSLNSKQAELRFESSLNARKMDLDRLVAVTAIPLPQSATPAETIDSIKVEQIEQREFITNFLKGTFVANVEEFNYGLVEGENFKGTVEFDNNEMTIKGETDAMDGHFNMDGTLFFEKEPRLRAKLEADKVDATEFFRQAENFGQDVLQSKHVSGALNSKMVISAKWDAEGNFLYDKLRVIAGLGIKDGALKNFEMLESFSSFIKLEDLRHIKFVDVQNYFEVKKERLYIPVMFIRSNALNITLNGEHSFENDLDYNIKINAGQVVANKFKRHNPDKTPLPAKRNGWINLYYKIFGNLEDYEYKSAKREIKRDFEDSENHKLILKRALQQEFRNVELLEEPEEWSDQ